MQVATCAAPPTPVYAEAETTFAQTMAYLSSREALQMSESDLERELHRRGQELIRQLLQGHLDQRGPGKAAGPVAGADGVERPERRVHDRRLETTFGTVEVERVGYGARGHESLHPLDASLNLPPERYSLEVRRRVAEAAASRSYDEALFDLSRHTGAEVPKRQAEQLVARAAEDFDAFYEARRAEEGEPSPEDSVVVLTFDGKGVVLHRDDLREATRRAAEKRRQQREQLSPFNRLKPGEKKHAKRMATVAAVYTTAPLVRSPEEFLRSLMPRQPGAKPPQAPPVRPRPQAKRVWASLEREPWEVKISRRSQKFTLTAATQRKRLPVHVLFVLLLLATGGLMARSLLFPSTAAPGIMLWIEVARLPLGILGFTLTAVFYIRWNDRWFRQHADQEFRLQQLALDVDRAGYATEMLLEWQEEKRAELPAVLVDRLTAGLVTDQTTIARARHPAEDVTGALLKASSGVRIDLPGIGEVTLTGRQIRKLDRSLSKERGE